MERKLKKYTPTPFMLPDSRYDKASADYAVSFIEALSHTKGKWAGKPFSLIDWQERIVRDLFGVLKPNGYRQFNMAYVEIPKKMGKLLALDTLIPTPSGFTTMGQIAVGDAVFDEKGHICHVTAKSARDTKEQAWRITFRDGQVVVAGENHQWAGQLNGKACVMTTGEIAKQKDNFRIPAAHAINTPARELPMPSYQMGKACAQSQSPLPLPYLRAAYRERLAVFRGYCDALDWYGKTTYTAPSPCTAENLSELLWSLGIFNILRQNTLRFTVPSVPHATPPYRYIAKMEKVKNPCMQCIEVDSPSHQYLVGRSFLPTHNSELAAAIALLLTCGDGEERAEVYGCASDRQQASIVFDVAADMVRMCPALSRRVKILTAQKRIVYAPTNSFYQVLSSEAFSKHGFNVHGVIFDELHSQPNRKLFDVMTKGSGDARTQPLYFLITTAGTDTHSICYETHEKARDILDGRKVDPTFYPVIYGAEMDDDWTDPKVWKKANPSLGITVGIDKVEQACASARQNPAEENTFRQLRLNQWVKQSVRWMPMEKWDACRRTIDPNALKGRVCYGGLDLSSTTDITAFVLVFPPLEDDAYTVLPFFWVPEDTLDRRVSRDHVPYDVWQRQGYLNTTDGNVVHYGYIEKFIEKLGEQYNIREIAFDRWGAVQMSQDLDDMGFTLVQFGQGYKDMSPPTKELMKLVLEGNLCHDGNPVLRWMMDNIFIKQDPAGNIKPDKEKSNEKIDGAVAMIMALDRAIRCGATGGASVYDDRDLLVI